MLKRKVHDAAKVIAESEEKRSVEEALNQYVASRHANLRLPSNLIISYRICVSPQCGFASHSEGNNVSDDDVQKKLTLVVQTASELWSDA